MGSYLCAKKLVWYEKGQLLAAQKVYKGLSLIKVCLFLFYVLPLIPVIPYRFLCSLVSKFISSQLL